MLFGSIIPNMPKMYLVVDPNTVISASIIKGNISKIFSLNHEKKKFDFVAPLFLILELGKHTNKIANKTHFSQEEVKKEIEFVLNQITFIPDEQWIGKIKEAKISLKGHEKDVPYLALALAFNCKIFSGDKILKSIIPDKVITPKELLEIFQNC